MSEKKIMMPGLPVTNISGPLYTAEQMHEYAKSAIELNQKETAKQEPRPFDLEAAKRGEPIVTRDGRKAHFVAHDPGAHEGYRVLARVDSEMCAGAYREDGRVFECDSRGDLLMAQKPKRVVWVNLCKDMSGYVWPTEEKAKNMAGAIKPGAESKVIRVELD